MAARLPALPPALNPGTHPPPPTAVRSWYSWPQVPASPRASFPFLCLGIVCLEGPLPHTSPPPGDTASLWPPAISACLVSGLPSQQRWPSGPAPSRQLLPTLSAPLSLQAPTPCRDPCSPIAAPRRCSLVATSGWGVWWAESRRVPHARHLRLEVSTQVQSTLGLCLSTRGSSAPDPKGRRPPAQAGTSQSV